MTELDIKRKALELLSKGRYADAIAQYESLLESSRKKNPAILNLVGDIHVKQSEFEAAFECYLDASRLYAEDSFFHNAIAVGKKILRLDRDQTEVYGILGNLYARQGLGMDCIKFLNEYTRRKEASDEFPAALAAYAEACEIMTECAEVQIAYGELLERVGRHEDAATAYGTASRIYAGKGQYKAAEKWSQRAGDEQQGEREEEDSGVRSAAELMNLKTLDEDTSAPDAPGLELTSVRDDAYAATDPVEPNPENVSGGAPWTAYDATANPELPPPPPLPTAAPPATDGGLELDLGAGAPAEESARTDPPRGPDSTPEDRGGTTPEDESALSLHDLPGVILPDHAMNSDSGSDPFRDDDAGGSETVTADAARAPEAEATPVPAATTDADADLAAFFESTLGSAPAGEPAVIVGDDFELLREGGDVSEVIADFRAATMEVLDLDDYQAHYDLGTTYMEMELFDESAAEFEIAAQGDDFALASREMLGYCFLRKGQIELAIRELRRGLELRADERDKLGILYNLGIACGVLDDESEAIASFQRILEVDPNFRDTRTRLERLVQNSS